LSLHCPIYIVLFLSHPPATPDTYTFPYTTLFRSRRRRIAIPGGVGFRVAGERRVWKADAQSLSRGNARPHPAGGALPAAARCLSDRKSTRLNSSHVSIWYAVFC